MELQKRIDEFNTELKAMLDKHKFALSAESLIVEGLIKSKVVVVDKAEEDKPAEKDAKEEAKS